MISTGLYPLMPRARWAAYHAGRVARHKRSYDEVFQLAEHGVRHCESLGGIHALMALFTLLAQMGHPVATQPGDNLTSASSVEPPDSAAMIEAANLLRRLQRSMIAPSLDWNPIQLFAAMARGECDYAVFTFAYVTAQKQNIRFALCPGFKATVRPVARSSAVRDSRFQPPSSS